MHATCGLLNPTPGRCALLMPAKHRSDVMDASAARIKLLDNSAEQLGTNVGALRPTSAAFLDVLLHTQQDPSQCTLRLTERRAFIKSMQC